MIGILRRRRRARRADEIIDMSSGPFRCTINYSLLARVISWRRALGWLQRSGFVHRENA